MTPEQPQKPPSPQERTAAALESLVGFMERRDDLDRRDRQERERREREDRPPQRELHKIPFTRHLLSYGLAEIFARTIPGDFWIEDTEGVQVSCPCGGTPITAEEIPTTCTCGRAYLYDGREVRVAFSPLDQPEQEPAPA